MYESGVGTKGTWCGGGLDSSFGLPKQGFAARFELVRAILIYFRAQACSLAQPKGNTLVPEFYAVNGTAGTTFSADCGCVEDSRVRYHDEFGLVLHLFFSDRITDETWSVRDF